MSENARQLRKNMTDTEQCLWRHLRKKQLGDALFRRQFEVGAYIVDFVCLSARLIVECDGGQHQEQQAYDQRRDAYLRAQGFTILRFWNHEVLQETSVVLERILSYLTLHPNPPPQGRRGLEEPCHSQILQEREKGILDKIENSSNKNKLTAHCVVLSKVFSPETLSTVGAAVTIGAFDGVHLGHQHLISQLKAQAKASGLLSIVVVFEPHPKEFFAAMQGQSLSRMTYLRDKATFLKSLGVDALWVLRFNRSLLECPASDFIHTLHAQLSMKSLLIGDDFRFGKDRLGDFALLKTLGRNLGFSVFASQTYRMLGARVSSSRVRDALLRGDFQQAARLQGREFSVQGHVVYGDQLGQTLGFPTINLALKSRFVLHGIYAVWVSLPGYSGRVLGAASIGTRPAVQGKDLRLEVHLLDFSGNLYGQIVTVTFLQKIREEQNFPSLEALTAQIQRDCEAVRALYKACPI